MKSPMATQWLVASHAERRTRVRAASVECAIAIRIELPIAVVEDAYPIAKTVDRPFTHDR